jgi:hypothetical protein
MRSPTLLMFCENLLVWGIDLDDLLQAVLVLRDDPQGFL